MVEETQSTPGIFIRTGTMTDSALHDNAGRQACWTGLASDCGVTPATDDVTSEDVWVGGVKERLQLVIEVWTLKVRAIVRSC